MKRIIAIFIFSLSALGVLSAQTKISSAEDIMKQINLKDTYTNEYLDKVPGQHIIMTFGDWTDKVRDVCNLLDIEVVE